MRRTRDRKDDAVRDVRSDERLNALVDVLGCLAVAMESHQAELRLDHARLDLSHPDRLAVEVEPLSARDRVHCMFSGGVACSALVRLEPRDRPHVDDVSMARLAY